MEERVARYGKIGVRHWPLYFRVIDTSARTLPMGTPFDEVGTLFAPSQRLSRVTFQPEYIDLLVYIIYSINIYICVIFYALYMHNYGNIYYVY